MASRPSSTPPPSSERLLNWKELKSRVTLCRSTITRMERDGHFPHSIKLSPGRVAWRESEVVAWIAKRQENTGAYVAD